MNSLEQFLEARIGKPAPNLTLHGWAALLAEEYILYVTNCLGRKGLVAQGVERILRGKR